MKTAKDYLETLRNDMHSVVMAAADKEKHPVTRVIDIMLVDDTTLYFLTAHGKVQNIGKKKLDEIFEKNPYMASINPDPVSREALEVFRMMEGEGEFFDLSTKPVTRASFSIGDNCHKDTAVHYAYQISDKCTGCGKCVSVCPQKCIITDKISYVIAQKHCLHCGNCFHDCPVNAVLHNESRADI